MTINRNQGLVAHAHTFFSVWTLMLSQSEPTSSKNTNNSIDFILVSFTNDSWMCVLNFLNCVCMSVCRLGHHCCDKIPWQAQLREKGLSLAQRSKLQAITARKSRQQSLRELVLSHPQSETESTCSYAQLAFSALTQLRILLLRTALTTFRLDLLRSFSIINILQKFSEANLRGDNQMYTQRLAFQVSGQHRILTITACLCFCRHACQSARVEIRRHSVESILFPTFRRVPGHLPSLLVLLFSHTIFHFICFVLVSTVCSLNLLPIFIINSLHETPSILHSWNPTPGILVIDP